WKPLQTLRASHCVGKFNSQCVAPGANLSFSSPILTTFRMPGHRRSPPRGKEDRQGTVSVSPGGCGLFPRASVIFPMRSGGDRNGHRTRLAHRHVHLGTEGRESAPEPCADAVEPVVVLERKHLSRGEEPEAAEVLQFHPG